MFFIIQCLVGATFIAYAVTYRFREYSWWEYVLQVMIPVTITVIVFHLTTYVRTLDTEYWSDTTTRVEYQERYEEWDPCASTYECNCTTDKDGRRTCSTCCRGGCVSHGPYYYAYDSKGNRRNVRAMTYETVANKFGGHRNTGETRGDYCGRGDLWRANWPGTTETYQIFASVHRYVNKVRLNKVYVPESATREEKRSVFDYPGVVDIEQQHILGEWYNTPELIEAEAMLDYFNGTRGPKAREDRGQIKTFILLFKDRSKSVARVQAGAWERGNKNEYILMLGWDSKKNQVTWYDVMTFSRNTACINRMKEYLHVNASDASLPEIAEQMTTILSKHWLRREFTQMNALVSVTPPWWLWLMCIIINIAIGIGLLYGFGNNMYRPRIFLKQKQ